MTDQHLTDLLETAGDRHEVGSPPVDADASRRTPSDVGPRGPRWCRPDARDGGHRDPGAGADEGG